MADLIQANKGQGSQPREKTPGSRTVLVACNIPNGIVLRVFAERTVNEPVLGGGSRAVKEFTQETGRATLRGPAVPVGHDKTFKMPIVDSNGYALTRVDADLWEAWLAENRNSAAVVNGCVYAKDHSDGDTRKGDTDHRGFKSGLEPLNMDDGIDARMPRNRRSVTVGTADRAA